MRRKILITGGKGDIAQAIELLARRLGYEVFSPSHCEMDVTHFEEIEDIISIYKPDILINNAGYIFPQSVRKADLDITRQHIEINLAGLFYCTEIGLKYNPYLQIINIGSAAAIEPHATWSEYCATKAAVVMATRCWAEDGIYVVTISPGRTRTKMRKSLYPDEDQGTLLDPVDFAKVVIKAINKNYESGSHIVVRKQNIEQLLSENEKEKRI